MKPYCVTLNPKVVFEMALEEEYELLLEIQEPMIRLSSSVLAEWQQMERIVQQHDTAQE